MIFHCDPVSTVVKGSIQRLKGRFFSWVVYGIINCWNMHGKAGPDRRGES